MVNIFEVVGSIRNISEKYCEVVANVKTTTFCDMFGGGGPSAASYPVGRLPGEAPQRHLLGKTKPAP